MFSDYWTRTKEIQSLQWELFKDYWYMQLGLLVIGMVLVFAWVWFKKK